MDIRPKVRNAAFVAALAAVGATAWATSDSMTDSSYTPANTVSTAQPAAVSANDTFGTTEALSPNESVVATREEVAQPPITVETRRLTEDERIQQAVMDKILNTPNISGKIGVESNDSVVRLSGYTMTAGQAWRAGRDASGVIGVKYVKNEIRPRIGGSV